MSLNEKYNRHFTPSFAGQSTLSTRNMSNYKISLVNYVNLVKLILTQLVKRQSTSFDFFKSKIDFKVMR